MTFGTAHRLIEGPFLAAKSKKAKSSSRHAYLGPAPKIGAPLVYPKEVPLRRPSTKQRQAQLLKASLLAYKALGFRVQCHGNIHGRQGLVRVVFSGINTNNKQLSLMALRFQQRWQTQIRARHEYPQILIAPPQKIPQSLNVHQLQGLSRSLMSALPLSRCVLTGISFGAAYLACSISQLSEHQQPYGLMLLGYHAGIKEGQLVDNMGSSLNNILGYMGSLKKNPALLMALSCRPDLFYQRVLDARKGRQIWVKASEESLMYLACMTHIRDEVNIKSESQEQRLAAALLLRSLIRSTSLSSLNARVEQARIRQLYLSGRDETMFRDESDQLEKGLSCHLVRDEKGGHVNFTLSRMADVLLCSVSARSKQNDQGFVMKRPWLG